MKMAKASERDIDAAGRAMGLLDTISRGYYPSREGEENTPTMFDENDPDHLRRFYDEMTATLDASPGWLGRVIGGMCYVILYKANEIIDPDADTLELHPKLAGALAGHDGLVAALREVCAVIESNPSSIADTVWVTGNSPETLLDHCRAALSAAGATSEAARAADDAQTTEQQEQAK